MHGQAVSGGQTSLPCEWHRDPGRIPSACSVRAQVLCGASQLPRLCTGTAATAVVCCLGLPWLVAPVLLDKPDYMVAQCIMPVTALQEPCLQPFLSSDAQDGQCLRLCCRVHGPGTHLLPLTELAAQWTAFRRPGQVAGLPAADPSAWRLVKAPDTGPDGHPPPDREEVKKWHQDVAVELQVQGAVWCVPLGDSLNLVVGPKNSSTRGLHWLIQQSDLS